MFIRPVLNCQRGCSAATDKKEHFAQLTLSDLIIRPRINQAKMKAKLSHVYVHSFWKYNIFLCLNPLLKRFTLASQLRLISIPSFWTTPRPCWWRCPVSGGTVRCTCRPGQTPACSSRQYTPRQHSAFITDTFQLPQRSQNVYLPCLLYTSDAADE